MLESARLVSIIREVEEKEIISIIEGLVEEGIRWFEISLSDGENGMKCIRTSRKYFEGRDVYIGAGTVKKKEEIDVLSDMPLLYPGNQTVSWSLHQHRSLRAFLQSSSVPPMHLCRDGSAGIPGLL